MSFQQGLSGLAAAARNLDAIGNNVANASTVGFKSSSLVFADIYANAQGASLSTTVGIGTAVAAVQANFGQGNLRSTSNPLDVAINGSGFFRMDTNGAITYSRNGQFHLDKDGFIVNATGSKLTGYGTDAAGNILVSSPQPLQVSSAQLAATATANGETAPLVSGTDTEYGTAEPAESIEPSVLYLSVPSGAAMATPSSAPRTVQVFAAVFTK